MTSISFNNKSANLPLNTFLKQIKYNLNAGNFYIADYRIKNKELIQEYGLIIDDIKNIIYKLTTKDAINKTSESDLNGYPGYVYAFNTLYEGIKIYIKIRFNPPDEVVCISFHLSDNYT